VTRGLTVAIVFAIGMHAAQGAGYDDFTQGMTANLRGDYAGAVTAFTSALAAPDLAAAYKPVAYRGRANAYLKQDKCQDAMADIKAFESLASQDDSIAVYRIWAELCLKDGAAARKDLDALAKGKLDASDLWEFARLEWKYELFSEAAATAGEAFQAADKKELTASYILLWQAVAAQRAGKFDAAAITAGLAGTELDDWPKPLFDLYLGKQTPQGVQKEAESWRKSREDGQRCEANFYTAEWHLGQGDKASATPLLLAVVEKCPIEFIELPAAQSELERLGVPLPKE
jgi:lipoprotein NlpI